MPALYNLFDQEKKVSLSELFFDVIFVYAISKIAHTILHVHHGVVSPDLFFKYTMMTLIFTIIWSYQTFFTNRYGMIRPKDIIFMMVNMFIVIYLSNSLYPDFDKTYFPFVLCTSLLFLSIAIQYTINYFETVKTEDKNVCRIFFTSLYISAFISLTALIVPDAFHYHFFFTAVGIASFGPLLGQRTLVKSPVNFPHLVERYSLLTIIMFGELMIGLANIFSIEHFDFMSIFQFAIVVFTFWVYWIKVDYFIDHHQKTSGFILCYSHLLIFLALGALNAAIVLSENFEVHEDFKIHLMFLSLGLFYFGIFSNFELFHNKHQNHRMMISTFFILIIGYIFSLLLIHVQHSLTLMAFISVTLIFTIFLRQQKIKTIS